MASRWVSRLFQGLLTGDPVAVGILSVFVLAALAFVVVWLRTDREMRREDEERRRRYGATRSARRRSQS